MRIALAVLGGLLVLVLGTIQGCSEVALRDRAAGVSVARILPANIVAGIEPANYQSSLMRYVLGNAALTRGDVARAAHFARWLPDGPDRDLLEGAIDDRSGKHELALGKYLHAGDFARLEARVDELASSHRLSDALALESGVIAQLAMTNAQNDTVAEALYHQGLLNQAMAYTIALGDPRRAIYENSARGDYAHAFALAPLEDRYGLALGNQLLNVGNLAAARSTFLRVRDLDPASPDPLTGLADAAIRAHDYSGASAYLDSAEKIAPGSPAVARFRARLPKP